MGWEWHNRDRDSKGRWRRTEKTEQLHIRVNVFQRELIRARANARHMDISEYLMDLVTRDLHGAEYVTEEG